MSNSCNCSGNCCAGGCSCNHVRASPALANIASMKPSQSDAQVIEGFKQSAVRWIARHGFGLPESEDN